MYHRQRRWWSNLEILFGPLHRSSPFIGELRCQAIQMEHGRYIAERTQNAVNIVRCRHRNQTISRKGANIFSRRPSHGHLARRCCPQAFLQIFSEVSYIKTVGNSTLLKIYTLPNHTITIGVCVLETQLLGLLYGGGASFVQKWSMPGPCRGYLLIYRSLSYIVLFLWMSVYNTHSYGNGMVW
jgi:hypothetical protein